MGAALTAFRESTWYTHIRVDFRPQQRAYMYRRTPRRFKAQSVKLKLVAIMDALTGWIFLLIACAYEYWSGPGPGVDMRERLQTPSSPPSFISLVFIIAVIIWIRMESTDYFFLKK